MENQPKRILFTYRDNDVYHALVPRLEEVAREEGLTVERFVLPRGEELPKAEADYPSTLAEALSKEYAVWITDETFHFPSLRFMRTVKNEVPFTETFILDYVGDEASKRLINQRIYSNAMVPPLTGGKEDRSKQRYEMESEMYYSLSDTELVAKTGEAVVPLLREIAKHEGCTKMYVLAQCIASHEPFDSFHDKWHYERQCKRYPETKLYSEEESDRLALDTVTQWIQAAGMEAIVAENSSAIPAGSVVLGDRHARDGFDLTGKRKYMLPLESLIYSMEKNGIVSEYSPTSKQVQEAIVNFFREYFRKVAPGRSRTMKISQALGIGALVLGLSSCENNPCVEYSRYPQEYRDRCQEYQTIKGVPISVTGGSGGSLTALLEVEGKCVLAYSLGHSENDVQAAALIRSEISDGDVEPIYITGRPDRDTFVITMVGAKGDVVKLEDYYCKDLLSNKRKCQRE
ncbi:hypothetical protein HZC30_01035 [Candidatus Woesearchaeota archaeon]|nr:hypothetical protein [Candidatus Woesearchaeota archaeon]